MAVPKTEHYQTALAKGNTLKTPPHIHWIRGAKENWVKRQSDRRVVAVELAEDATPLALLAPAAEPTVVLLGHERHGVPEHLWDEIDETVEIPMIGSGSSLNVAVAGSLILYRLSGLG